MRRPLAKLLLLFTCGLIVAVCNPQPAGEPPTRRATVPVDFGEHVQLIAAQQQYDTLTAWYTWASQIPTTTVVQQGSASAAVKQPTEESEQAAHFDPGSVQALIVEVFGDAAPAALHVAHCESGYRPDARNGQYVGIFQLGNYHRARAERLGFSWEQVSTEAYPNIVVAHDLYLEQGWRPWECRP